MDLPRFVATAIILFIQIHNTYGYVFKTIRGKRALANDTLRQYAVGIEDCILHCLNEQGCSRANFNDEICEMFEENVGERILLENDESSIHICKFSCIVNSIVEFQFIAMCI